MTARPVRVLAISGSLRRRSHNKSLLDALAQSAPLGIDIRVYEHLADVPLFNSDVADIATPPGVQRLREAMAWSDAVLVATPEYNQAVPGVVKNMIDWLSLGDADEGFEGKPVAVTGVTTGPWGTRLAQTMLRQMLTSVGAVLMPAPTLYLRDAGDLFDADGRLVDTTTRRRLVDLVVALRDWTARLSAGTTYDGSGTASFSVAG